MADLITKDDVRLLDPTLGTNVDDVLAVLITAQSQFVIDYTGRDFSATSYTERQGYATSNDTVIPKHAPIVSVQSLVIDGDTVPQSTSANVDGWRIDGGTVKLQGYTVRPKSKVIIVYTAGAVSDSIKYAVAQLVLLAMKERGSIGTATQSMAGYTVSYLPSRVPDRVREVLEQHKVRGF